MKVTRYISTAVVAMGLVATPLLGFAAEKKAEAKAKPYKLEKCLVSDEKLGEMGKPFVFEYKGQEIKLCCKDCKKDFDKDPAKYLKKMDEELKKADAARKPKAAK